jgi:type III restriction enzyme
MNLFDYQGNAAKQLVERIGDKLDIYTTLSAKGRSPKTETVHFISPTGSGKTVTAFATMDELSKQYDNLVFVWIAPNTLHVQSQGKFVNYADEMGSLLNPIDSDNIHRDNILRPNDILCLNWGSVDKASNSLIKSNEEGLYIDNIVALTKQQGNLIIVMIDESHIASQNEKTKANDFLVKLNPVVRVDITATPKEVDKNDDMVIVERQEVIDAGVIKKEFIFNDFDDQQIDKEKLTQLAYARLQDIKAVYDDVTGGKVNPLMIIQIENDKAEEFRKVQFEIESYLDKMGISKNLIAYYLSEDKSNSDDLAKNDDFRQIVFTKTAIATGWDCPRASVLLTFRKSNDDKFKTQVLGRINRMPELKHYGIELLDTAYVFANADRYIPDGLDNVNVKTRKQKSESKVALKEECQNIFKLPIYTKEDVIEAFRDTEYDIKDDVRKYIVEFWNKISDYSTPNVTNSIIQKLRVSDITLITYGDNNAEYVLKNKEIEDEFYAVLKSNGFSPVSSGKIQSSLFENTDDLSVFDGGVLVEILRETARNTTSNGSLSYLDVIKMIFNGDNYPAFAATVKKIADVAQKKRFRKVRQDGIFEDSEISYSWIPSDWYVCQQDKTTNQTKKNIYQADCIDVLNKDEKAFVCLLESDENVAFWYKNSDKGREFFRVPYKRDNKIREFFPDFIVKYIDGTVGIYDTKSEMTAADGEAKDKAEYLYKYCEKFGHKGGLIKMIPVSGTVKQFTINDKEHYTNYDPNTVQWVEFGKAIDIEKACINI